MDNKSSPIWSRRTNTGSSTGNLSLSTGQTDTAPAPRDYSSLARRNGTTSSHGSRPNPFSSAMTSSNSGGVTSPTAGGSGGFGIGHGAFASFGSAKTPKTPGNPFEMAMGSVGSGNKTPGAEKSLKDVLRSTASKPTTTTASEISTGKKPALQMTSHPLTDTWVFWTRPPIGKANGKIEYQKTLHAIAKVQSVEDFWLVYKHLKSPSQLPAVTDIHLFKQGVPPIWEHEENKQGGKWILRLKKGVANRYWEEILMACIGDQISDGTGIVNGAVLSVRNGEDVISIWTSTTDSKVLKIREKMRTVLKCPTHTLFEFRTHDQSLSNRQNLDEQRREKAANNHGERDGAKRTSRGNPVDKLPQDDQRS